MEELFQILETNLQNGQEAVLATIISSSGSTPRGEGARMLVTREGRVSGTIGGGAVEHHSEGVACEVLESKESHAEHFRLKQNEIQDLGMICGGDVHVYFQYIDPDEQNKTIVETILGLYKRREEFWLVNEISESGAGSMAVCSKAGDVTGMKVPKEILENLKNKSAKIEMNGQSFYCEKMIKPGKVYIFGGGHVSQALVPALAAVDFRCVILEDREEFCRPELFPLAEEVLLIENTKISVYVDICEEDYVCIMTRGHKDDLTVQAQVLKTPASYIGVIGSRHKKAGVFAKLKEMGFTDDDLGRVTTPIGLSIEAETPAEIAVSIAAQLIQRRAKG